MWDANIAHIRGAANALVVAATAGASEQNNDHPWISVVGRIGLASAAQVRFVWSVAAHCFDPRCAAHLTAAFGNSARLGLSIAQHALLCRLSDDEVNDVLEILSNNHPLQSLEVLLPQEPGTLSVSSPWRVNARVLNELRGIADVDPVVQRYGAVINADHGIESQNQREVRKQLASWLASREKMTVLLLGAPGGGQTSALARAAAPRQLVVADFQQVPGKMAREVVVAVLREAALREALPVLENLDVLWSKLESAQEVQLAVTSCIANIAGPVVITSGPLGIDLGYSVRTMVRQNWPLPEPATRIELWQSAFMEHAGKLSLSQSEIAEIAGRYAFGSGAIEASTRSALRHASAHGRSAPQFSDVIDGVRDNIAERLGEVARRVEVTQTWDELVLSPETRDDVTALINRVRFAHRVLDGWGFRSKLARGSGAAGLFSGPPGTGKTMVAGLIARELQLDLYQIDLSKIVSKWVGETEKQLARVFDAAEAGHALLLFDEADALFAKRSADVKSAVDRYANLEVNYLLQRVESFGGVVILTTNLDASIDPALRRRLAAHITFGAPEYEERLRLWKQMLSSTADYVGDLGIEDLANEFEDMTGANIRNAVLAGAFLAAGENGPIRAQHLMRGAQGEYRSMGRVLSRRGK
jgi:hypothetical protein